MIPLASEPISIIPQITPPVPLTTSQRAKMVAIEAAIGMLNGASVAFTLFASPDEGSNLDPKVVTGQRLSYAPDVETIVKETPYARQAIMTAALQTITNGMKGGVCVFSETGIPIVIFQGGKPTTVKAAPVVQEPQVVA